VLASAEVIVPGKEYFMRGKNACIVADLRTGEHLAKIPDIVTVLSAAGWKIDVALKEYGGETLKLAQKATRDGYDLVMGYGGDGTLNAVFNGVMNAGGKCLVADLPGGTYNIWAGTIGVPHDPVKAALAIVNSEARKVDLGHVEVDGLAFPNGMGNDQQSTNSTKTRKKPERSSQVRQYFLLHVGMGIDAAMMAHISKPLKYHFGPLAFDLSTIKELPEQRPFPVQVQVMNKAGNVETHWQGEAWEVIVSKVPIFGGAVNLDPDAHVDDGLLNVCLITANGPVKTIEQALSILAQKKLDAETTRYFRGAHFSIQVPASIGMQVDGSVVELEELLPKSEQNVMQDAPDAEQVMVNYRFDAMPRALQMAIPYTYSGSLFSRPSSKGNSQQQVDKRGSTLQQIDTQPEQAQQDSQRHFQSTQKTAYEVTVIGVSPIPEKQHRYIVAGSYKKRDTDETEVVAVRINDHTLMLNSEGAHIPPTAIWELQEGEKIVVEGDKTKRGVIRASCVSFSR
jgi:diacylglycerol kinase family enzyme